MYLVMLKTVLNCFKNLPKFEIDFFPADLILEVFSLQSTAFCVTCYNTHNPQMITFC